MSGNSADNGNRYSAVTRGQGNLEKVIFRQGLKFMSDDCADSNNSYTADIRAKNKPIT